MKKKIKTERERADERYRTKGILPNSTAWPFKLDQMPAFTWHKDFMTPEECDKIIKLGKSLSPHVASIGGEDGPTFKKKNKRRKSKVAWIIPTTEVLWLYRRLTDGVKAQNNEYYQFDLFGACEGIQFTNYKAPGGYYGAHIDRAKGIMVRKLSVTIQLSDPDSYEGGDLILYEGAAGTKLPREKGMLIIFPSFYLHEVLPVTKGERNSLVSWITGPGFK